MQWFLLRGGLFIILFFVISSCTPGGKYGEVKSYMNEVLNAYEEYATSIQKASKAEDAVTIINRMTKKIEAFMPRYKVLLKKYPEIKKWSISKHPAELNPEFDRQKSVSKQMEEASRKLTKFLKDPKVSIANKNMEKARARMGKIGAF